MNPETIGTLVRTEQRYELRYPELGLKIQGPYVEWVFEAAAEIVHKLERLRLESSIEELELMREFGDENEISISIDCKKFELGSRFDVVPQCLISLGPSDYRWVSSASQAPKSARIGDRLHDVSMTRSDTFEGRNGQTEPQFTTVRV